MLFIDLANREVHEEELSEELARNYIGGYGIGVRVLMERMKPGVEPLGPDNILGMGTGPMTASGGLSACRYTALGKSPLTGYWGDANSGGNFANALKGAGYDIVFFSGKAEHPVYVMIVDGKVEIKDARHIWGSDTGKTDEIIRQENGNPALKIASIGLGGERLSRIAAIMNDRGRAAARSGLGAVMGSKNLKAVACLGSARAKVFDSDGVGKLMKTMLQKLQEQPNPGFTMLNENGTPGAMYPHLAVHAVPIKNWAGNNVEDFPSRQWDAVGWAGMAKYVRKKYACTACTIGCGGILDVDHEKYPGASVHKPEYESLAAFGPNCLNDDMASMIRANEICNSQGLDTISAGAVVSFAIECYENGIISKSDTGGLELKWGNGEAVVRLLEMICRREGIGDLLAEGAKIAAEKLGKGAEQFAMHVGGEMIAMHDPRETPGWGATYVCDPTPARHTRGGTAFIENGMGIPDVLDGLGFPRTMEKFDPKGKGRVHAPLAGWQHIIHTSGLCLFVSDALGYPVVDMMRAVTGWDVTFDELVKTGLRIGTLQHAFNLREGFKPSDFVMPERITGKPPFKVGPFKDLTLDFEELKRQFYEAMKFDYLSGAIQTDRIVELGLQDVLPC
jgi:aldehyde:ferredoxin oxidoreductase